jgi:hypothetical protein
LRSLGGNGAGIDATCLVAPQCVGGAISHSSFRYVFAVHWSQLGGDVPQAGGPHLTAHPVARVGVATLGISFVMSRWLAPAAAHPTPRARTVRTRPATLALSQGAFAQIRRALKSGFDQCLHLDFPDLAVSARGRAWSTAPFQSGRNARSQEDRGTAFPSRATSLRCTPLSEVFRAPVLEALCARSIIFKLQ